MPAVVTSNFRISNARNFIDSFEEFVNGGRQTVVGQSYVYLFIGKVLAWDKTHVGYSDTVIPTPDGDIQGNSFEPWRDMIALDRVIANNDISFGIKRHDWISGTRYAQYDDQDPTIPKATAAFYVYTDAGNVFKCLDNNDPALSTELPTKPSAALLHEAFVTLSDGYRWKYMYTNPSGTDKKFLTTNYVPVQTLNAFTEFTAGDPPDGFEDQAKVQENANNGTIENYVVTSGGAGFTAHSGAISDVNRVTIPGPWANTTFLTLGTAASSEAGRYTGGVIYLSNSTYEKGVATIKEYGMLGLKDTGALKDFAVSLDEPGFAATLSPSREVAETEYYHIGPRIDVVGDGFSANAYTICTTTGSISQVKTWKTGNSYTTANATVYGSGSGVQIRPIISPPGGHGSDPIAELNGYNVIISKTLSGAGTINPITGLGSNFPISNEYRIVGLVKNPFLRDGYAGPGAYPTPGTTVLTPATSGKNWYANSSPLHQTTLLVANTTELFSTADNLWTPTADDEIQGENSKATGRVIEYNADSVSNIIVIGNVVANTTGGSFIGTEQINRLRDKEGGTYTSTYVTANGFHTDGLTTSLYLPDLQPFTGDILYVEYRAPIVRSDEQAEDIKIVIEF